MVPKSAGKADAKTVDGCHRLGFESFRPPDHGWVYLAEFPVSHARVLWAKVGTRSSFGIQAWASLALAPSPWPRLRPSRSSPLANVAMAALQAGMLRLRLALAPL